MNTKTHPAIAWLEIVTGIGIILFWIGFFTVGVAPETPPEGYFVFEHSFPPPDCMLSALLIIAGVLLLKGRSRGVVLSLVASGGLMFLGILDASFNIQNGMYAITPLDTILNLFINLWCFGFGLVTALVLGKEAAAR
jgi:hypothetical protein